MELPKLMVTLDEVYEKIRGHDGTLDVPDPIECLLQAEGPDWKLDGCRFLLSQTLSNTYGSREQAYFAECAAMTLASVFDVLLHEIVHYYGLNLTTPPKDIRWNRPFRDRLAAADGQLVKLLTQVRSTLWFRRAMGFRHYVTHHAGLLQHIEVHLPEGRQTYSMIGDEYFDQDNGIDRPKRFRDGCLDRAALVDEIIEYMDEMCRVVDQVRLHCFDYAPVFYASRKRSLSVQLHDV